MHTRYYEVLSIFYFLGLGGHLFFRKKLGGLQIFFRRKFVFFVNMEDPPQLRGGGGVHIKKMNGPLEGVENSVRFRGATRFFARSEDGEFPMFHNDFMFCQSAT